MSMGQQHFVQAFEAQAAFQDLSLRPFAAIEQEAVLPVHDNMRGEATMDGWGRGGGAKEDEFKHICQCNKKSGWRKT